MLKEAYGDEQMRNASFYRWFNKLFYGNEQVKDEPKPGTPKRAHKEENFSNCRSWRCKSVECL